MRRASINRLTLGLVGLLLVGIQLVPMDLSNPPVLHDVTAPHPVADILRNACYNCHSRETSWPWYSKVAPVSWFVAGHVKDGRHALDFSDWPVLDFDAQDDLLRHIARQVSDGKMPPTSYKIAHPVARLTDEERDAVVRWAEGR